MNATLNTVSKGTLLRWSIIKTSRNWIKVALGSSIPSEKDLTILFKHTMANTSSRIKM